ncbi:excinuclease ABC subunit UvrC [Pendulispora albinea]|uniref:UvrABC system protein C n=1 Tax=Pendulispora albinea TaxID=2741071 RepID=A0ABZ2M8A3_9BACT
MLPDVVQEKLRALPAESGVYLFKDKKGEAVYVGKAKSLRSRVRSYFQSGSSDTRLFIPHLLETIGDLETIVTANEKEATILENTLIKELRPRYNVKLRDDKEYLSLRLNVTHAWPRLDVVRKPAADGARYFGPYHSATAARRALHLINKHFQLRTCSDLELTSRRRPCLQYQIKRCPAPCVYEVDPAWYKDQVRAVAMFIEGRHDELSHELADRMRNAARETRFELAAVYRDQLRAIEQVRQSQRVVSADDDVEKDVIGLYREGEGDLVELVILHVRAGRLGEVGTFAVKHAEIPDEEIVAAFIAQHYGDVEPDLEDEGEAGARDAVAGDPAPRDVTAVRDMTVARVPIPREIVVPCLPEGHAGIGEWLSDKAGHKVSIVHPKRGARADLLAMANDNARHAFLEKRRVSDSVEERLAQLQERLRLPTLPRRIECCDISHLGGGDTVGAIVAMTDGVPDKKRYRTFHVRGTSTPNRSSGGELVGDDYAAMYEVLARRFRRGLAAGAGQGPGVLEDVSKAGAASLEDVSEAGAVSLEDVSKTDPTPLDDVSDADPTPLDDVSDADPTPLDDVSEATIVEDPGVAESADGEATSQLGGTEADPWELPDLFVVDGGRGQLGVALAAARDLGLHHLPIVGLAKEKENVLGETMVDRVYLPGQKNPIPLKTHSASLFFLARLRDEAHRFSNRGREKRGKARRLHSVLDDVPGIGPNTKKALLKALGSASAVQRADDATLLAVPGVNKRHVAALRKVFPGPATTPDEATT